MSGTNYPSNSEQSSQTNSASTDAASLGVSLVISPADTMYRGRQEHYLAVGRGALALVQQAAALARLDRIESFLDLPCGFGRVQRWLRAAYPGVEITACDTQAAAVAFCEQQFGARGVRATADDAHWANLGGPFDVIWCGSLLTHFNENRWFPLLRHFEQTVAPHGVVIFTTHGHRALHLMTSGRNKYGLTEDVIPGLVETATRQGFGFKPKSGDYGVSVSLPEWVRKQLQRETGFEIIHYGEAGWDNHQDVVMCLRRS